MSARVGDRLRCELRCPIQRTLTVLLSTPEAAAYANELLAEKPGVWVLVPSVDAALAVGDEVWTNYNGRAQLVRLVARREGCKSQTGVMFQTEPMLRTWRDSSSPYDEFPAWYDAGWFRRVR